MLSDVSYEITSFTDSIAYSGTKYNTLELLNYISLEIIGSYIDEHNFKDYKGGRFKTSKLKKPLFIEVTSSNCKPCKAEIPALNKIAKKYKDSVDFLLLYADNTKKVTSLSSNYSDVIYLIPHEGNSRKTLDFSGFKHALPYPSKYYVTSDKKVVHFSLGGYFMPEKGKINKKTADSLNFSKLESKLEFLLSQEKIIEH